MILAFVSALLPSRDDFKASVYCIDSDDGDERFAFNGFGRYSVFPLPFLAVEPGGTLKSPGSF